MHQLAPQYMDTGKVRLVFKHLAQIGPESEWAAQASECANDQGKFWAFANYVFTHQAGENQGALSRANLKQFAVSVGLDIPTFNSCFDSNKYADLVKQQTSEGRSRGVRATPSFFVNGQFIEGMPAKDAFARFLDSKIPKQ